jgi:acylphosphatase
MEKTAGVHCVVQGLVQGIGYRWFVQKKARDLGIAGWVSNLDDGSVEVEAEGQRSVLEEFIRALRFDHPWAHVEDIEVTWSPEGTATAFSGFDIR